MPKPPPGVFKRKVRGKELPNWTVVIDHGTDPVTGKRIRRQHSGFKTLKEACDARTEFLSQRDKGTAVEPSKLTLGAYLQDHWLPAKKPLDGPEAAGRGHLDRLSIGTYSAYRGDLMAYVIPRPISRVRIQKLEARHLNELYRELEQHGKRAGKCATSGVTCSKHDCSPENHQGLAAKTLSNIHGILHQALGDALKDGLVSRNVASAANRPRSDKPEWDVWGRDELRTFLKHVKDDRFYAGWLLFATTGMRRGEVAGLTWDDLDLEAGEARIRWTLGMVDSKPTWKTRAKSKAGGRTMALDPAAVAALKAWKKRQAEERLKVGPSWIETNTDHRGVSREDVVFTHPDGRFLSPRLISDQFAARSKEAGLRIIRLHDLRHTYASVGLENATGWGDIKVISERLGHANVAITLDTYSHVLPARDREVANTLAEVILGDA